MAELTHFYDEENSEGTMGTGSTYTNTMPFGSDPAQILGSALSANTKYLIVARALWSSNNAAALHGLRVQTDDDSTIEAKSEALTEFQQTGATARLSYLFVHSFTTSGSPADVEFQLQRDTSAVEHIDQSSLHLLDLDAINDTSRDTYYFDGTVSDPDTSWTNDANIADGSTSTAATGSTAGDATADYIEVNGTTAPTSGDAILDVKARVYAHRTAGVNPLYVAFYNGGVEVQAGVSVHNSDSEGWGSLVDVAAPGGGWTWSILDGLEARTYITGPSTYDVYRVELLVTSRSGGEVYFEQATAVDGGTDLSATEATTILAEIDGSDMGTDEHLILGYGRWDNGNNGKYGEVTLYTALDASSQAEVAYSRREGEDTAEQVVVGFAARHQASSGTPNATIYGETASGGGGQHEDGGGYIIALPSSLFLDSVFEYTAAATSGLDGTETTIESSGSYTPTTTGNHLIFGHAHGSGTPTALGGMHVESTTTPIRTGDAYADGLSHNQMWDTNKDDEMMACFQRYGITTAETFNLRAQGAGADFEVADRWLIVINLNKPSIGPALFPPFLRRPPRHVRM